MKKCLACDKLYDERENVCPFCGEAPELEQGIRVFAPELAHGGANFTCTGFSYLAKKEEKSFWFTNRSKLIVHFLHTYANNMKSFMEIGCGTGYVLSCIQKEFPHTEITGAEVFIEGLQYAKLRLPNASFFQMDARRIPFVDEFDVIGAFDVLEHIKEDEICLQQIHGALHKNGIFLATVPQHPSLWSAFDERSCHVRRYARGELEKKLAGAGFQLLRSTSFVSLLLPVMYLVRLMETKQGAAAPNDEPDELAPRPFINAALSMFMSFERVLISAGLSFPCGGSRLVIARK